MNLQIVKVGGGAQPYKIKKKGAFTLVELLAVIILLGLLGLIIYPTVNGVINTNKQKLHDKQIEELIKYADTYATYNMSKLRAYDGARNIVTFTDLYEAGIIQNDKVVDPANDEELLGCMALTWNRERQAFDIEYTEKCGNSFSINGTISGTHTSDVKIRLVADNQVFHETTTDSSGNYSLNGILPGKYILLASKPFKTKYGEEVEIYEDTTKNMAITLYDGDFNEDDVIDAKDSTFAVNCIYKMIGGNDATGCFNNGLTQMSFDLDGSNTISEFDASRAIANVSANYISNIKLSGTANLSGRYTQDGKSEPTIVLKSYDNTYNAVISNGMFTFTNIPRGTYFLRISKSGYLMYGQFVYLDKDISNIKASIYAGNFNSDFIIDSEDENQLKTAIGNGSTQARYDLNEDGVVDNKDLALLRSNLGKKSNGME